jgi:transposase
MRRAPLAGFAGILQVDGYAAYNRLARSAGANEGVTLAACFAHVWRRFYELHVNESSHLATQTATTTAGLWEIEADIRGQDPATRVKARQEKSAAIVAALFDLWEKELPRLSGKSKLAEAIRYATSRRTALERFLNDGRIEIDSNTIERAIRALFAGSHSGGRTWATIATLLQTAKMNDVDPHAWLTQSLERIAQGWPISQIDALMPGTSKPDGLSFALTDHRYARSRCCRKSAGRRSRTLIPGDGISGRFGDARATGSGSGTVVL